MSSPKLILVLSFLIMCFSSEQTLAKEKWWEKLLKGAKELTKDDKAQPTNMDIGSAFKEALKIGSENVVSQLGRVDGFNSDEAIHIPLPKNLKKVKKILKKLGMSKMVSDFELKLNRAAESATPLAKELFWQSIRELSFSDIKTIYEGPDDSATQYFRIKMSPTLDKAMRPIIENSLSEVGAIEAFDKMMTKYKSLPFVPDVKADLIEYVVVKCMDGIFFYLAKEEAEIRSNPMKQTTDLLKRVFGGF